MQVGVSTASLFMRQDNEEALQTLNGLGVKTTEVFLTSYFQYGKGYAQRLLQSRGDICVNSVHDLTSQFEPQLFSRHDGVRQDAYNMLGQVMESAQLLDAPYYTFHGITRAKKTERLGEKDDFTHWGNCFRNLLDFCQGYGVKLCLETVEWSTYNRPGVFAKIAGRVPNLLGVLDIKQTRISGYGYEPYLKEMGNKIAYVHLSDVTEEGKMCLPGNGAFDFDDLIVRLKDVGFDGALLIEAYERDYDDIPQLKQSCEYLQELVYKHGC